MTSSESLKVFSTKVNLQNLKNCESELSYILAELFSKCLKESCFPDYWKVSSVVPVFKNVGEKYTAKNYHPVSLVSVVSKVCEKLVNNRIVDPLEKRGLFSDFQVLGLLDQLLILSQLYLIELLGLLTGLELLKQCYLIYPRLLTGFGMLVIFRNISLMEFQVRYLPLFPLFSVIDTYQVVLDGKSSQECSVNVVVLQGSILGPTLFLLYINDLPAMLHVILLPMLMILLSILNVIGHLICGNNFSWLLNLNLIYKTLWTGLLISMLGKFSWLHLTSLLTMVLLM